MRARLITANRVYVYSPMEVCSGQGRTERVSR
jgi:hypothetical protein